VIRLIGSLLVRGEKNSIEIIASSLGMSPRNLQFKLKEEKTTYQNLLGAVRKEIALSYLREKEATICDIAFLLGFSEQSAFNHAFKRWTGFTPREYLRKSDQ
jgi:AraC-like DNA-binding protein